MADFIIKEAVINPVQPIQNEPVKSKVIPLTGKLVTSEDPLTIGNNFKTYKNMRPTATHPRAIGGMSKVNSSVMDGTYIKVRSAWHLNKEQPAETHVLVQAYNTGLTASRVLDNKTAIGSTGNFEATDVWSDTGTVDYAKFSEATEGQVVYCNGTDTCIWGGTELRCARLLSYDTAGTFLYDYTDYITNTKTTEYASMASSSDVGGITSSILLLSLNNNVTDTSPVTAHTVTNVNVTFSTTAKFGTHAAVFNGSDAKLTIPDDADFDFSDGTFAFDCWLKYGGAANGSLYYHSKPVTKVIYDTGAHEVIVGETVHQNVTGATGVVLSVDNSGGWAGAGTGTIWLGGVTGTWGNANNMEDADHNTVANCATSSTDTNYFKINIASSGATISVIKRYLGADTTIISATSLSLSTTSFDHIEVDENGNTWYIFVNGVLVATATSAERAESDYSSIVTIGYDDGTAWLNGTVDEYRLSSTYRHTGAFTPPTAAYTTATYVANFYIGALRPLKGVKFYAGTVNTAASSTATIYYWDGSAWVSCSSQSDGTSVGGVTLAQTGTLSFTSTVSTAKPKYIDGNYLYYYKVSFTGVDAGTTLYYVTLDAPFQRIVDIWDGVDRNIGLVYLYEDSTYKDYTVQLFQDIYDSADATTYATLNSLTATTEYLLCGFTERMAAISLYVAPGQTNSTANTIATVYYWNGSAWTSVGTIEDGTSETAISLYKPGTISWNPPAESLEYRKSINNGIPLYYYKIVWSQNLDSTVQLYYVSGTPAQSTIDNYRFSIYSQNRLLLCNDMTKKKNVIRYSSADSSQIFNGDDSGELEFGDETALTCGCSLFAQFGANLYNLSILFKDSEMWTLNYSNDATWIRYKITETIGCPAPLTVCTTIAPPNEQMKDMNKYVAVWQSHNGIYISDGRAPRCISDDISDRFDQSKSTCINQAYLRKSVGFMDELNIEYHWLYCNGTPSDATSPLNKEMVFSFKEWKWYEVDRTTGKYLQCGLTVRDTYGNALTYGFIDTGYMEALEWLNSTAGTIKTFDGEDITCTLELGDAPLDEGNLTNEHRVIGAMLVQVAKTTTTNNATLSHYTDTSSTAVTSTHDPTSSGYRLAFPFKEESSTPGVFHSFGLTMTTDDETIAFEPLLLIAFFNHVRPHDYEKTW